MEHRSSSGPQGAERREGFNAPWNNGASLAQTRFALCVSVRALGADSTIVSATMADYISVSEALKLVSPFKEEKGGY